MLPSILSPKNNTKKNLPLWKWLLSYLWSVPLEQLNSQVNPDLELFICKGRLRLNTSEATYSYEDLYHTYFNAFQHLNLPTGSMNQTLILGYGLGSIPLMLEQHFNYHIKQYTGVEFDPEIVRLCQDYLPTSLLKKTKIHAADAYDFLLKNDHKQQYDLICHDIFLDLIIPEKCQQTNYLEALNKRLKPGGHLLYNTLMFQPALAENAIHFYEGNFKAVFPTASHIEGNGNRMLIYKSPKSKA